MTNEEHIEQLKKLRSFHNGSYGRSINKAIEALEQPEIIRCEDCEEWQRGSDLNGARCCSDEGFCCNWRVITGEDFYCGDAVKRGK